MFTGLVQEIGTIDEVKRGAAGATLRVRCGFAPLTLGESIAVDGVCLSVTRIVEGGFFADASAETLEKTTLGKKASVGQRVHLERALRVGDKLGGHLVTGHVDGVGQVVGASPLGDALRWEVEVPPALAPFLAPKGSITVDGTSLTVNGVRGARFDVVLVPVTRRETLLGDKKAGSPVNIEVDVLAKYVASLLGRPGVDGTGGEGTGGEGVGLDLLTRQGYV